MTEKHSVFSIEKSEGTTSKHTQKATTWGVAIFKDWLFERFPQEALESLSIYLLSVRLTKFYQEVKKSLTEHYSYSAHLSIRAALDRYLNSLPQFSSISITRDQLFKPANKSLNVKLKMLKAEGLSDVHHHPSISAEDVKKCYEMKVFGDETPLSLLRVNWFNISLYFCSRGRDNQRSLTKDSFEIKTDLNGDEYVTMTTSESAKNNRDGLADQGAPKMFSQSDSTRCPVKYLKKFLGVLNPNQMALFQKPKRNVVPDDPVWFENFPIGVNRIGKMMREISTDACLSRIYTNHSVKSTTASILEGAGIPFNINRRQCVNNEKECSNVLAKFSGSLQQSEQVSSNTNENKNTCIQINIVANGNHLPTINVMTKTEIKDCEVSFKITKV